MSYPISDVTRRVVYSGSAGVGPYSFTFEILSQTDIAVYKDTTLLTLTTDYTVTINTNGTGSITLVVAATSANSITIVGDRGIQRSTDFVTGGDLFANSLNQELDALTIYAQQVDEKSERAIKAPVTDPTNITMMLPSVAARANRYLTFDSSGNIAVDGDIPDVQYYGTSTTDPATRPNATATQAGDMYFNTVSNAMRIYNGSAWQDVAQGVSFPYTTFSGNGSTTAFTLTGTPGSLGSIEAFISGVRQTPGTDYTWSSGTTLTFTSAPPSGTNNIFVRWLTTQAINVPADGSVTTAKIVDGAVTTSKHADASITTAKIADANVTPAKLSTGGPTWDASGNLGIGTSSPSTKLEINTESSYSGVRLKGTSSASSGFEMALSGSGVNGYLWNYENGAVLFATNNTERARISSSGNVGIGTSSPEVKLDVAGTEVLCRLTGTGSQFQGMQIRNNHASASQPADVFYDAVNESGAVVANMLASVQTDGGSSWIWSTQPPGTRTDRRVERMRIDSSGNLLVGTTSNTSNAGPSIVQQAQSGNETFIRINHNSAASSGGWFMGFSYNGTAIGSITQNGTTATAYNTSSDYRLKENIQPMTGALAKVAALKPCTYKWKVDGSDGEGFIAHELAEVVPQCVTGEKDAVDAEGKPVYQGIDTSFLVATLTAAIQEQQAIIEQLKADVAALKGQA